MCMNFIYGVSLQTIVHVVLSDEYTKWPYSTVNKVSELLKEKYNLEHVTLQIENIHLNHLDEDYFKQYEE